MTDEKKTEEPVKQEPAKADPVKPEGGLDDEKVSKMIAEQLEPMKEALAKMQSERDDALAQLKVAQEANKALGGSGVNPTEKVWVKVGSEMKQVDKATAEQMKKDGVINGIVASTVDKIIGRR